MNSHILILKSLQPVVCRVNTTSDEYEEEQPCVITDNLSYQLKDTALWKDVASATLPENHMPINKGEDLIEHAKDKASEQQFIDSPFKLPQLMLSD